MMAAFAVVRGFANGQSVTWYTKADNNRLWSIDLNL